MLGTPGSLDAHYRFNTTSRKCNKGSDRDEEEEIEKLMREGDDVVDIMYLTSLDVVEVAELYEESSLSEDKFLSTAAELAIPKKPQNKSKISAATATGLVQRRMRVEEHKGRGDEMVEFVPHRSPVELDLELREEVFETLKERGTLAKENEDLGKKKEETKLAIEEKRKICEEKIEAQEKEIKKMKEVGAELKKNVDLLVHSSMKDHIVEFLKSTTFNNIVNLYHLPMAILAFIDYRKKVKAQYPKVDVTGRIIFPPNFDFEFVAIEEGAEVGVAEVGENVSKEEGNQEEVNQPTPPIE
ncbi:hypothetical protein SLEP1_g11640 [Rubroshorea leprosula]|nr:hypothetical protein SLEP1_g11640 [Rubroshorea leprosula]